MTTVRCRDCGHWLTLDDDERDALWEQPSPGAICWNCDQDERWDISPRDLR